MRTRRHRRVVAIGLALGLSCSAGTAWAAFSSITSNGPNSFSAAADLRAPEVARSVIVKSQGGEVGFIRPAGGYFIYAQVDDVGNPASGTASVQANFFDAPLAAGAFPAGGASYNWRTAQRPATGSAAGTYPYGLVVTDNAGNSATRTGYSVVVDGTAPTATDIQTTNGGSIAGRPEADDTITFTTSEPIDPQSVLAGWDGSATEVTVRLTQNGSIDPLTVYNRANTTQLPLGSVTLNGNYVGANRTFGASGTRSSMVRSGNAITVRLGTQSGAGTTVTANTTMTWTPVSTPYDRAGNALSTTARNETGGGDREF